MKKRWMLFGLSVMLLVGIAFLAHGAGKAHAAAQQEFYVSPEGSDTAGDGTLASPFASMDRARLAVRSYLAGHTLTGDVVVYFRGGTYRQTATVVFDAADSGKDGFDVVYRNMPDEKPVFSGGEAIKNWVPENVNVYKTNVYNSVYGSVYSSAYSSVYSSVYGSVYDPIDFRQIYVDESKGIRARNPNEGSYFTMTGTAEKDCRETDGFNIPNYTLRGAADSSDKIEVSILLDWMHKRLRIHQTDPVPGNDNAARAVINGIEWNAATNPALPQAKRNYCNKPYWLENAKEFLDSPGEWYFNRDTGDLYYWPRAGENMNTAEVIVPKVETLILLKGDFTAPVTDLVFQGLEFRHTNWTRPNRAGFVDIQANSLIPASPDASRDTQYRHNLRKDRIPGAITALTSDRIQIIGNRFANLGGTGILFDMGGNDNVIKGNAFTDLSAGAVEIGNDAIRPNDTANLSDSRMWPRRNTVSNNYIARIGTDYFGSVGILGYYNDSLLVEHNEIEDIPYTGISVGWGWSDCAQESKNNKIQYNLISNFMKRMIDGGGIYTLCSQPSSSIANNYVRNQLNQYAAIYLDENTRYYTVNSNVISLVPEWLFIQQFSNPATNNAAQWNFTDSSYSRNDPTVNTVSDNAIVTSGNWSAQAQAIMNNAGLEPAYKYLKGPQNTGPVIVDNADSGFNVISGTWTLSSGLPYKYGADYRYAISSASASAKVRWSPNLTESGSYDVFVWYPGYSSRCTNCKFKVNYYGGSQEVQINETVNGGGWVRLGNFPFLAGATGNVELTNQANGSFVDADAVKFMKQEIIVDNADPGFAAISGVWYTASGMADKYGADYRYAVSAATATAKARWTPNITLPGDYKVSVWYPAHSNRCTNCSYTVNYNSGSQTVTVNQAANGGRWTPLGTFAFSAGTGGNVELTNKADGSYVGADAVKFEKQ